MYFFFSSFLFFFSYAFEVNSRKRSRSFTVFSDYIITNPKSKRKGETKRKKKFDILSKKKKKSSLGEIDVRGIEHLKRNTVHLGNKKKTQNDFLQCRDAHQVNK